METIISLIPNTEALINVRQTLKKAGFTENEVGVPRRPGDVWWRLDGWQKVWQVLKSTAIGVLFGPSVLVQNLYPYIEGVLIGKAIFVIETTEDSSVETKRILRRERGTLVRNINEENGFQAIRLVKNHY